MGRIIAGIYEIQQKIGSGGGGVVYLGFHLRLNKQVVLKADKRSLNTSPDVLRREVDMLKGLSHTYIPQVYDFVQEDGIVYTVMDYIEGESLDHILERGQTPPQPQLIQWACQILEALVYLHGQPPHGILHADIKPANIILRPNGDICLIDYNIALALGEDGAVKVGYSIGYASPEHYGVDDLRTGSFSRESESGSTAGHRPVMLDVRSDIYSLGATLYHLISGKRPSQHAEKVEPLDGEICSPAVAAIIMKAMSREPGDRYQTAEEMLLAFTQLHTRDKRVLRRRRRMTAVTAAALIIAVTGGACTFVGLKQMEQRQTCLTLAEYSADQLAKGNVSGAIDLALQAIPDGDSILEAPVTAEARKALTDALNVYNLEDSFQSLDVVELPSAPYSVEMSPDGTRFAAVCQHQIEVYDTESRTLLANIPSVDSALAEAFFLDSKRILCAGAEGVTLYNIENSEVLWTGQEATFLTVSGNGAVAAAINRDEDQAVLYNIDTGEQIGKKSFDGKHKEVAYNDIFANPANSIFSLNQDGTKLAVSFSDGGLIIYDLKNPADNLYMYDSSEYTSFEGGFSGKYFAFAAQKSDQSLFGIIDTEEGIYVGEIESRNPMRLKTDEHGIWLSEQNLLVCFDRETLKDTEMAFTDQWNIEGFAMDGPYVLVTTDDSGFSFFDSGANQMSHEYTEEPSDFAALAGSYALLANRSQPAVRLMKLENHRESQLLSYDARYTHDEARLNPDMTKAMLFGYEGFRIYDQNGKQMAEGTFPEPDKIYDQQFRREELDSWLEVIWYDGTVRHYSGEDGTMIQEMQTEPPSKDLYEEFFTSKYRFASELHSAPKVYSLETGNLVTELEKDSYLTYVTEVGEYIVTEYVSAAGERYGLLLNQELETLAYLPNLCDIVEDTLIFDYETGDLRQSRFYSLQELKSLGVSYKEEKGETK